MNNAEIYDLLKGVIIPETENGVIKPNDIIKLYIKSGCITDLDRTHFTLTLGQEVGTNYYNYLKDTGDKIYSKYLAFIRAKIKGESNKNLQPRIHELLNDINELLEKRFGLIREVDYTFGIKVVKDIATQIELAKLEDTPKNLKGIHMISFILRATRIE